MNKESKKKKPMPPKKIIGCTEYLKRIKRKKRKT